MTSAAPNPDEAPPDRARLVPRIIARLGPPRTQIHTEELPGPTALKHSKESCDSAANAGRSRSKTAALAVALAVHAIIALIATLVLFEEEKESPPLIEVSAGDASSPDGPENSRPEKNRTRRPTTTGRPIPALATANSSSVTFPTIDAFDVDRLDLGTIDFGQMSFGPKGGGASFLGLPSRKESSHIVLLIDVSGSMRSLGFTGLDAIRREVNRTVNQLKPGMRFNIFTFASHVDAFRSRSVQATPERKKEAIAFFDAYFRNNVGFYETRTAQFGNNGVDANGIHYTPITSRDFRNLRGIDGGTRIELGIIAAMQDRPETIYLLSDGEPNSYRDDRPIGDQALLGIIDSQYRGLYRVRSGLQINTISVLDQGERFLRKLKDAYNGLYKSISPTNL